MADADAALKERFIEEWLKTDNPYEAGNTVFPNDALRACRAASEWQHDPQIRLRYELKKTEGGDGSSILSKEQLAKKVLNLADEKHELTQEYKHSATARREALRLYAELMGYIEKPAAKSETADEDKTTFVIAPYA